MLHVLSTVLLLLGFLLTGVLGTDTSLLFFWPGCAVLGLAGVLATVNWRLRVYSAPSDLCLLSVVALAGYLVVRGFASPVAVHAREDVVMVLAALVVYLLSATSLSHPQWRMGLVMVIVLLLIGNLLVGFIHFSGCWAFHVVPHFARTYAEGRVGGFFNNANHLGAFLCMSFLLLLGVICFGRAGVAAKLLLGFLCVAAAIELRLTLSRAALLGAGAGGLMLVMLSLWMVWRTSRHLFGMILVGGGIALVLGGAVIHQVGAENLRRRMSNSPVESDARLSIWHSALQQHALAPAVGTGSRTFADYGIMLRRPDAPGHQKDPIFVHNEYLQMLADYGWLGIGLIVVVLVLHLGNGIRFVHWFAHWRFGESGEVRSDSLGLAIGSMAALVAGLVHAVFEFHFHVPAVILFGAFVCGVLMNPGFKLDSHQPQRVPGLRPVSKLLAGAAAAGMVAATVIWAPADYAATQAEMARARSDKAGEEAWLDRALSLDPKRAELHYRKGLVTLGKVATPITEAGAELLEQAAASLRKAVELHPLHYLYAVALTDALDIQGRESEGLQAAQQAIRAAPHHEEARLALALHYSRFGRFEEAERTFLWVDKASAKNAPEEMSWFDYYREMLKLAQKQSSFPSAGG